MTAAFIEKRGFYAKFFILIHFKKLLLYLHADLRTCALVFLEVFKLRVAVIVILKI